MIKGIDVSNNNGVINWRDVAKAGYAFALIKATESTDFRDSTFVRNAKVAKERGLITGAYHFARPTRGDAVAQARFYLSELAKAPAVDMPPIKMLDEEDAGKLNNAQLVTWCRNFGETIKGAHGSKPLLYASSSFIREHGLHVLADLYDLFVADYTTAKQPDLGGWPHPWKFWQHSQSGNISGHAGAFDLDVFNGTLVDLQNFIDASKGVEKLAYQHTTVDVAGTDYDAIVVGDVTHVLWTACEALGSTVKNILHDGTLDINGKEVKCVVDGGDDYVPWAQMAHGVQAHKVNGKWHFSVAQKPQPVPTPAPKPTPSRLPTVVNLWQWHGALHNQLNQGACTGEATVGTREWYEVKQGPLSAFVRGAPEATYAWARIAEGDLNKDAGAQLYDALMTLVNYGMAPSSDDVLNATDEFASPSAQAVADAEKFKIKGVNAVSYGGKQAATNVRQALAGGNPVAVAFTFNTAFYAPTPEGVVDYTKGTTQPSEGHAFIILGYAPASTFGITGYTGTLYAAQNSWGTQYGVRLPGTNESGFMLLTEETVNALLFNAYTLDI